MLRFSFRKASSEEEGFSEKEETVTGPLSQSSAEHNSGRRRVLVIAGIGVILIGGWYLAQRLFFAPPPPPPAGPVRSATLPPPAAIPNATSPTKDAPITQPPLAPPKPPAKDEVKSNPPEASTKVENPTPPVKGVSPEPTATAPPAGPQADTNAGVPTKVESKHAGKPIPVSFSLQMGAMVKAENAESLKRKLDADGFPAVIRKGSAYVSKQIVTVGEPTGKREAEELSRRLNVDGFPSQLLAVGDKYTPQIGAYYTENDAIDVARELQKKNYSPKIAYKPSTTVIYQVRHGRFDSRAAAVKRGEELKGKGFSFLVVRD